MKRHGGNIVHITKKSIWRLNTIWSELCDILEKLVKRSVVAKDWGEGRMNKQNIEEL